MSLTLKQKEFILLKGLIDSLTIQKNEIIKELIANKCNHPKEYCTPYNWEHDDGYGRQTKHEGLRCYFCGAKKRWLGLGSSDYMGGWCKE